MKVHKGRGRGATCYIEDTFGNTNTVLHDGMTSKEAEAMLKGLKAEEAYREWVWLRRGHWVKETR